MKQKSNKAFIIYISCAIAVILLAVIVLGVFLKFLVTIPYFDKCLHLLCAVFITGILGLWLARKQNISPLYAMLFVFCFAITADIAVEIIEFGVDTLFTANNQHWIWTEADRFGFFGITAQGTGLVDTMGDIIATTVGSAIASIFSFFWLRKRIKNSDTL